MARVAVSGNGNHHFAEDPARLAGLLENELTDLRQVVARQTAVTMSLPAGVSFVRGFDREFYAEGNTVRVPIGDIQAGAQRTVLMQLKVNAGVTESQLVADVALDYQDLHALRPVQVRGALSAALTRDAGQVVASRAKRTSR